MAVIEHVGARTTRWLEEFGDFWRFTGRTHVAAPVSLSRWHGLRLLLEQMFEIGTRSLPVILITGTFVGMVLAVQTVQQFQSAGLESQLGVIVNLSVIRELGPVLAGVLLAGRVGGAIAAEVGTMRVTEQIDALRAMGADPIRHLVAPRFLACTLLSPFLVIYADVMGILGGYYIASYVYNVSAADYWRYSDTAIEFFDVGLGLIKSVMFGGTMALICCFKAFRCAPGAAGVGRACTEAFVVSCMMILALDFFLNVLLGAIYQALYGMPIRVFT